MTPVTLTLDHQPYDIAPLPSATLTQILALRPLDLEVVRFAGHEYYAELPETPEARDATTSHLLAGHLYYWGEGNTLVLNFADYDIAPYRSVDLGAFIDPAAIAYLQNAGDHIHIRLDPPRA